MLHEERDNKLLRLKLLIRAAGEKAVDPWQYVACEERRDKRTGVGPVQDTCCRVGVD